MKIALPTASLLNSLLGMNGIAMAPPDTPATAMPVLITSIAVDTDSLSFTTVGEVASIEAFKTLCPHYE